jgi:hypothetical protein
MNEAWNKMYGNRKQKEKRYTHTIQTRYDDRTWADIEELSNSAECSKVEFVRIATRLFIDQLRETGVIEKIKAGIEND